MLGVFNDALENERARCPSRYGRVWVLFLEAHLVVLSDHEDVLSFEAEELLYFVLVEADYEHDLEIPSSHAHVGQHIRVVSAVYLNDGLHIVRDFLFACDFFAQEDCPSIISVVHHVMQALHSFDESPTSVRTALADD